MASNSESKPSSGAILHTGEHMFARSLQNLGIDIHVRKADTFRDDGRGFLIIKEKIPLDKLFMAEANVNKLIPEDLLITSEAFKDIESARAVYKNIRFNEDRLKETKDIRAVKIGDFDVSACKQKHADSTRDIIAFAVVDVSYLHGETTVEFKAGRESINYLLSRNDAMLSVCRDYNIPSSALDKTFRDIQKTSKAADAQAGALFTKLLEQSYKDVIDIKGVDISSFYKAIHKYIKDNPARCVILLSDTQLMALRGSKNSFILNEVGNKLKDENTFTGQVSEDYLNGRIMDYNKLNNILSGLPDKLL